MPGPLTSTQTAILSETEPSVDVHAQTMSATYWDRLEDGCTRDARSQPPLWPAIARMIAEDLTQRQRQIVELHYLRQLDQMEIAALLGITQQAVSEHLFGKASGGRRRGGVIPKLRKLCTERGLVL